MNIDGKHEIPLWSQITHCTADNMRFIYTLVLSAQPLIALGSKGEGLK